MLYILTNCMTLCNTCCMLRKLFTILDKVETTGFLMIFVVFANFVCKNYYFFFTNRVIPIFYNNVNSLYRINFSFKISQKAL